MENTSVSEIVQVAPAIWEDIRESLEAILITAGERVNDSKKQEDYDNSDEELPPAGNINCRICLENLPTIVLLACGHVICKRCSNKVIKCPFCRKVILGRRNLYF